LGQLLRRARNDALRLALAAAILAAAPGCGYHVSGHADLLPKSIRIIAVPAFGNATTRYRLADRLSSAVGREFLTRTRYRVVADPNLADAVLHGALVNYTSYPAVFDPATGRASGVLMVATLDISCSAASGEAIFVRPRWRSELRIAIDRAPISRSDTAVANEPRGARFDRQRVLGSSTRKLRMQFLAQIRKQPPGRCTCFWAPKTTGAKCAAGRWWSAPAPEEREPGCPAI
jgi:hypothetical protein